MLKTKTAQRAKKIRKDKETKGSKTKLKHNYATVEASSEDSINNIYWVCSMGNQEYYDDITGKLLKTELVMKARLEQLGEVKKL